MNISISKVQNLINLGKFDEANNILRPLLKKDPNNFKLIQFQFLIFLGIDDDANALKSLHLMSKIKQNYVVFNNIGNLERKLGNFESAIKNFNKAISLNNTKPEIFYNLGNVYSQMNNTNKAIDFFTKALVLDPEYSAALNNIGAEFLKLEDIKNARSYISKSLIVDDEKVETLINSVLVSIFENEYLPAIRLLNEAIKKGINDERLVFYFLILKSYLGKSEDLENLLPKLSNKNPLYIKLSAWKELYSHRSSIFSLSNFRNDMILSGIRLSDKKGLYLEFGVAAGHSINFIAKEIQTDIHGFDSFEGLDEEWNGLPDKAFSLDGKIPKVEKNVIIHKGYFNNTVEAFFNDNSDKISFMHIDCDLYSSTQIVLNLSVNNLAIGSVILFDEMVGYDGFEDHEFKAFNEFVSKYNVKYECLGINYLTGQVLIRILSL